MAATKGGTSTKTRFSVLTPQLQSSTPALACCPLEEMAKLVDLSNELLLIIVSYLVTGDDIDNKTLLNLCRTSRVFLDIAQPALYTCVWIAEPTPDPLKPLKVFLRTLLERPSLTKSTRKLALINDRGIRYEWPGLQHDSYFIGLSSLIGGHSFEIEPDLCYYPLAAEVLARLPNLQHIRFTAEIEPPRSLLERVHQLQAETSILSKLKTFHLYVIPMATSSYISLKNSADTILLSSGTRGTNRARSTSRTTYLSYDILHSKNSQPRVTFQMF
jgi:hypothetical protein